MIGIVASRADEASVHVRDRLLDEGDWRAREDDGRPDSDGGGRYHVADGFELRCFDDLHLHLEDVAAAFDAPDFLVFASRHSGDTGPLLTAHFTGNFGAAEFGGEPGDLARACPDAHARVLEALRAHAPDGYEVGMECTHHGPSRVGAPSMFVEVGSDEEQWRGPDAARAVARAILDLRGVEPDRERVVVGFGGGHYAPRFERIVRETDWAVGHVAADWAIDDGGLAPAVIDAAFDRSAASRAVIDGDLPDLANAVEELGYEVVSETWLRETSGVPLGLVERAEAVLSSVEDGLRFGDAASEADEDVDVRPIGLDEALVSDANAVDRERVREIVERHAVAFETSDGGSRVDGRVALLDGGYDALVDAFAALFAEHNEAVERREDVLAVRDTVFDPGTARALGVPEGPAFGRLANGESVEIEGGTIHPSQVREERTRRYPL